MNIGEYGTIKAMKVGRILAAVSIVALVAGCEDGQKLNLFKPKDKSTASQPSTSKSTKLVDRDVEAPDVFQVSSAGLWDGRPSLGGVWVAHADVKDPERVIIRNSRNGKFVIGALFRRERDNPGPKFQVSSDAADALGMLAGAPANLNVTALRREEVPVETPEATPKGALAAPSSVAETSLDPVASAAAAIDKAESTKATAPKPKPKPAAPQSSDLSKPYVQIGIFSVESNANNTATAMRTAGVVPIVKKQTTSGKTFWRVLVGPASSSSERSALLKKVKASGFTDAYAVTN